MGTRTLEDFPLRFQKAVVVLESGCWQWQGCKIHHGYTQIKYNGKAVSAHRFAFFIAHGHWPKRVIDHLCRNKSCVNPAHLEDVDQKTNIRRGSATKLTADKALEIRKSADPRRVIADKYGIHKSHVTAIKRGDVWV